MGDILKNDVLACVCIGFPGYALRRIQGHIKNIY
jgi:hypothetical protein